MTDAWMMRLVDPNPWTPPVPRPAAVRTARVEIREYQKGDGRKLFHAISSDRSALMPWMLWASTDHLTVDDSVYFVERSMRGMAQSAAW